MKTKASLKPKPRACASWSRTLPGTLARTNPKTKPRSVKAKPRPKSWSVRTLKEGEPCTSY